MDDDRASGSHRDPVPLRDLLGHAGARVGQSHAVEAGRLWAAWPEIVGPSIASHAEPTSLRSGVLRVRADSPTWATEVSYLAGEIKQRANASVGAEIVVEVRVWTKPGPVAPRRHEAAQPRRKQPRKDPPPDPASALDRARRAWSRARGAARTRISRNEESTW